MWISDVPLASVEAGWVCRWAAAAGLIQLCNLGFNPSSCKHLKLVCCIPCEIGGKHVPIVVAE